MNGAGGYGYVVVWLVLFWYIIVLSLGRGFTGHIMANNLCYGWQVAMSLFSSGEAGGRVIHGDLCASDLLAEVSSNASRAIDLLNVEAIGT